MHAAFAFPGTAAATFSHLISVSFGNSLSAFSSARSSPALQEPPPPSALPALPPASAASALGSSGFRLRRNCSNEPPAAAAAPNFAARMTLSGVRRPPNAAAIFSQRRGSPTGCFTICRRRSSSSWSVHSPASSSLWPPSKKAAASRGCSDAAGWTGPVIGSEGFGGSAVGFCRRRRRGAEAGSGVSSWGGSWGGRRRPRPTETSPPVAEEGAKGARRREAAIQTKREEMTW
uniref:Uncharacterized protein n=1 Tax=Arundo donax TaxID=35708 RepID=A0A0A9DIV7_ARUDO